MHIDLDITFTGRVKMVNGYIVDVVGTGTLIRDTEKGKRYIREVMLVSSLEENLLNVGQMMEHGYFLLFGDDVAEIYDDKTL